MRFAATKKVKAYFLFGTPTLGRGGRGGGAPFYAHNGGGGGYHTAQPDFGGSLLKVGNLPFSSTAQDLRNMFSEFGELTGAKIFYR